MVVKPRPTGEQIVALRKSRNLTQTAFGQIFGVSRRAVAAWESDTWRAPADILERFTNSAVAEVEEETKQNKETKAALEAYTTSRKSGLGHKDIIALWFRSGFTPSMEAQEAIYKAFPDIGAKQ